MKERRAVIIAFCVLSEYYSILFLYFIVILKYNNLIIIQKRECSSLSLSLTIVLNLYIIIYYILLFHHLSLYVYVLKIPYSHPQFPSHHCFFKFWKLMSGHNVILCKIQLFNSNCPNKFYFIFFLTFLSLVFLC